MALGAASLLAPLGPVSAADAKPAATSNAVTFTAVLPYDSDRLRRLARKISTPGTSKYRDFLSIEAAADKVGATQQMRADLLARAKTLGISVDFDRTGLTAQLTAPLDTWQSVYGADFLDYPDAAPQGAVSVYIPDADDTNIYNQSVPDGLRGLVRKLFPIDTKVINLASPAMDRPINEGTPFGPGADCIDDTLLPYTYSPNQLHVPYGTKALHERGLDGAGTKLAIIGIGQVYSPDMAQQAAGCFDYRYAPLDFVGSVGVGDVPVSGGPTVGIESNLDVQASGAVIPQAQGVTFIETASGVSFVQNMIQGYTTALATVHPDVITLSYGECVTGMKESGDWPARRQLDDLFAFSAIVGTSIVIAAGDSGSSSCLHGGLDDPSLQAGYPASSPWATAVGGTRIILGEGNERVNEVVWNSTTWDPELLGAGAGSPTTYRSPWYQRTISGVDRRTVPDIVAHAAVSPGWPVAMTAAQFEAFSGSPLPPGRTWGVGSVGGTSAASPFTAANFALIAAEHGRLGFLNPWLYSLAQKDLAPAFYDIVDGNNMVDPDPACCAAYQGYDMASGLGAPQFDALVDLVD